MRSRDDFTFFGNPSANGDGDGALMESSSFPLFVLLNIERLPFFEGDAGGLGTGIEVSASPWKTDMLGCCSSTLDITSVWWNDESWSSFDRYLRALVIFDHIVDRKGTEIGQVTQRGLRWWLQERAM